VILASVAAWLAHIRPHYLMIIHQPLAGEDQMFDGALKWENGEQDRRRHARAQSRRWLGHE
jgi:hypothetical protein